MCALRISTLEMKSAHSLDGAGEAVAAIYQEHGAFVWRTLRHLGVRPADLDDALQEVFMVVHRKYETWDGISAIRTWLFGIARMVSMNMRKRAHVRREQPVASLPEEFEPNQPEGLVGDARAFARAMQIIERLPEDLRLVFMLYEIDEMPMKDTATALKIPLQTAYSRLHRARSLFEEAARQFHDRGEE